MLEHDRYVYVQVIRHEYIIIFRAESYTFNVNLKNKSQITNPNIK